MQIGDRVTWMHTIRGGYGFREPVSAIVRGVTGARVKIETRRRRLGSNDPWEVEFKHVMPHSLKPRTEPCAELGEQ